MGRLRRLLPAVWLLALLATPVVAWLLGDRQPLLQNTAKQPFPAVSRVALGKPDTFKQLDAALLDRFPLRGLALDVRGTVALDVFGDSTSPDVAVGRHGWLYYKPELGPCEAGGAPLFDVPDAVDVLARTFIAAGYRPVIAMLGSKLFGHPEDAPAIDPTAERCERTLERRIETRLEQTPGGLTIDPLLRRDDAAGQPPFLRTNTHWSWRAREIFVRRLLDRIRPGLAEDVGIRAGETFQRSADLPALMGMTRSDTDRVVEALRAPRHPIPPGQVVLLGDSQLGLAMLEPRGSVPTIHDRVLPGQPACNWTDLTLGNCDEAIRAARTVVIEKVDRDAQFFTQYCWRPLALAGERLHGGTPGQWERIGVEARRTTRTVTIPASGAVTVRVRAPGGDVSATPRLLRLPVRLVDAAEKPTPITMSTVPGYGRPSPCATPVQQSNGALFLPVPAGQPVSKLVVQLASAPGTWLGPPQEMPLDGRVVSTG
jgi:hypothetical protein